MSETPTAPHGAYRDPRLVALADDSGYRIHERIGTGGMGIVYRAHDADGREVAIKLLRHEIADDPQARARLAREVAAQRLVRNDGIARILDAELESVDAFVVTEFVPGPTLEDAVRSREGLHPELVRELGISLCDALADIHAAGVLHRDLKPSNVLLRGATSEDLDEYEPSGYGLDPVIIDFGIALAAEESRMTSTGLVMGTAAYLDPVILRTNTIGKEGDWWALAALLAFSLTGREPFGTGRADVVLLRAERGEMDIEGVPTEFAAWLRETLRADPADRPSPELMRSRLEELDLESTTVPAWGAAGAGTAAGPAAGTAAGAGETTVLPAGEAAGRDDGAERGAGGPVEGADGTADEPPDASPPTEVMSAGTDIYPAGDPPTETLAPVRDQEPATEAFPVVGEPTRPLPVIRDPAPPVQSSPSPYPPVQRRTPQMPPQYGGAVPQQQQPHPAAQHQNPYAQAAQPGYPVQGQQVQQPQQPQYAPTGYPGLQPAPPPPRRTGLIWLGHAALVALSAVAPYVALVVFLVLGASARTWEHSHRTVARGASEGRSSTGTRWKAGGAAPFRFLLGLLVTALQALFPLALGALVAVAIDAVLTYLLDMNPLPDAALFATAFAIMLLLTWVGLGSRVTRDGAHRMLAAATPDTIWTLVIGGLVFVLVIAMASVIVTRGGNVDYLPFTGGPRLEDIAIWRR